MSKANILVVEDEGIVSADLQDRLRALDYAISGVAVTGEDAVKKAEQTRPDLALMDIVLKGKMDGIEAAEHLRSDLNIPVVYLTAYADTNTLERAKITEPYGYVVKPFDERSLRAAIEMALYRHQMETKLRGMERWLATAMCSLSDAVITTDKEGSITFVNVVAEALTGWSSSEAVGRSVQELFLPSNEILSHPLPDLVQRALREGTIIHVDSQNRLRSKTGVETPIDISAAPIRNDDQSIVGVILVFRDCERRREAEEDLKRLNEQLTKQLEQRGADLEITNKEFSAFTYSVAHDLRAPIRAINGVAQLLKEEHRAVDPDVEGFIEIIHRSARKMGGLVDDFLEMARLGQHRIQHTNLDMTELVKATVADSVPPNQSNRIKWVIEELPQITGDQKLIQCVWKQLINNACKFSRFRENPRIEISGRFEGNQACYFVRDNGMGFAPEYAEKLFTGFHKLHTNPELEGTGIGLAISKRIIERHGGKIWAEGKLNEGATIHFCLPVSKAAKSVKK